MTSGGDDPSFINDMAGWMAAHNVYEATLWDVDASTISPTMNPDSFDAVIGDFCEPSTSVAPLRTYDYLGAHDDNNDNNRGVDAGHDNGIDDHHHDGNRTDNNNRIYVNDHYHDDSNHHHDDDDPNDDDDDPDNHTLDSRDDHNHDNHDNDPDHHHDHDHQHRRLTTTTTTPPSTTGWACVTSAQSGECPFGPDPQITGVGGNDPYVDQNVWSPISGWQQTLSANGPGDWQVVANMPAGNTGVVAYPNTGVYLAGAGGRYAQTTSSFSETMHATPLTSAWAMYDLWYNNWADEVMIQYDFANNGDCTPVASATFGGSNGVPIQQWHLCDFGGGTLDWKLGSGEGAQKQDEQSGSIDILAMSEWLETHGYLPANSTWTAISDGWEICSTGGSDETFVLSNYSVTAVP